MQELLLSSIWHHPQPQAPSKGPHPEAGDARTGLASLLSWERLCCTPLLTAAPACEPPAEGCLAGSPCTKV